MNEEADYVFVAVQMDNQAHPALAKDHVKSRCRVILGVSTTREYGRLYKNTAGRHGEHTTAWTIALLQGRLWS